VGGCWAGKRWAGLKLEVGRTGNCDRCYTGIPTGISRIKNGIRQFGQENLSPDFDPVFAVFSRIFFPNPFFPENTISGRLKRHSASVGTGISRSYFHPYFHKLKNQVKLPIATAIFHNLIREMEGDEEWLDDQPDNINPADNIM